MVETFSSTVRPLNFFFSAHSFENFRLEISENTFFYTVFLGVTKKTPNQIWIFLRISSQQIRFDVNIHLRGD